MNYGFIKYLIPIIFLYYAYHLGIQRPGYGDDRGGFPTRRAKESEEIWNYVQRCAGIVCLVMAIVQFAATIVVDFLFPGNEAAYWAHMGLKLVCIVGIAPIVNIFTNRRFPKK